MNAQVGRLSPLPPLPPARSDEAAWRAPVEIVLAATSSVQVPFVMDKVRSSNGAPYHDGFVFKRGERFFGIVVLRNGTELVLPLTPRPILARTQDAPFGRRPSFPTGLRET